MGERAPAEHGFEPLKRSAEHGFGPLKRSAEHGFEPLKRFAEHGFTLIEVMVALAVFALAALALIRLEGATLRSAAVLDRTFLAQTVARNVAIDAVSQGRTPVLGPDSGTEVEAGRPWRWTRTISGTGDPRIVRIDVSVVDPNGQQLGHVTMIRPPSLAGQP